MPTLHLNGVQHFFRLEGHPGRLPLVLLHPIGADHGIFDLVVQPLLTRFQVLRPDLRGHGGSGVPARDCAIDDLSADLLALTAQLGWTRFIACGVSLGGMAALHAAIVSPERVSRLFLCSAAAAMAQPPGGWDARAAQARSEGMASLAGPMVQRMFSAEHLASGDPHVETMRTVFERMDPEGYARCLAVLRDTDMRPQLHLVRAPTCVMNGLRDPLVTTDKVQALLDGIPLATHHSFDCGHFPPVEVRAAFAEALLTRAAS